MDEDEPTSEPAAEAQISPPARHVESMIEDWFRRCFHNSAVSRDTATYNALSLGLQELRDIASERNLTTDDVTVWERKWLHGQAMSNDARETAADAVVELKKLTENSQ